MVMSSKNVMTMEEEKQHIRECFENAMKAVFESTPEAYNKLHQDLKDVKLSKQWDGLDNLACYGFKTMTFELESDYSDMFLEKLSMVFEDIVYACVKSIEPHIKFSAKVGEMTITKLDSGLKIDLEIKTVVLTKNNIDNTQDIEQVFKQIQSGNNFKIVSALKTLISDKETIKVSFGKETAIVKKSRSKSLDSRVKNKFIARSREKIISPKIGYVVEDHQDQKHSLGLLAVMGLQVLSRNNMVYG